MSNDFSKYDVLRIIDAAIDGNQSMLEWDYFVSVPHDDEFSKKWSMILAKVMSAYPGIKGALIDRQGVEKLKELRGILVES
jgi:hypothetical protein